MGEERWNKMRWKMVVYFIRRPKSSSDIQTFLLGEDYSTVFSIHGN
jgi:hypothetical protein